MESKGTGGLDCSFKVLDLPSDDLESLGKWVVDLCATHSGKSAYEILVEIESFRDQLSFVEAEHFNFLCKSLSSILEKSCVLKSRGSKAIRRK